MKRKIRLAVAALVIAASAGGLALAAQGNDDGDNGANIGLPNPASVFCEEQGGTVEIVADEDGNQSGICQLADGSEIEEWEYWRQFYGSEIEADKSTVIQVEVGPYFASADDGLQPGDPLAGALVRLFQGNTVVLETLLDSSGTTSIAPEPGSYSVQVSLDSSAPGGYCSWGSYVQDVSFPQSTLVIEAGYMCEGG